MFMVIFIPMVFLPQDFIIFSLPSLLLPTKKREKKVFSFPSSDATALPTLGTAY